MTQDFVPPAGVSRVYAGIGVDVNAWHAKGQQLLDHGRWDEAEAVFRQILAVNTSDAVAWCNLGTIGEARRRWRDAEFAYRRAAGAQPHFARAHNNLGSVLNTLARWQEAEAASRRAVALEPQLAEAHNNLGIALKSQGRLSEAERALRQALALRPDLAPVEANLTTVLRDQSRMEEARDHAWRAIELGLGDPCFHSNALSGEQYLRDVTPGRLAALHAEWDRRYASGLEPVARPPAEGGVDRPLRMGFVSPDLHRHPVAFFLLPVLEHLDPRACQVYCYSDCRREDEMTQRIRQRAAVWRPVSQLSDQALAERIAADRIDILFDLAGHTANNRLLAFARRPAAVQIAWIGYPGTTGLRAMDYILADRYVIPEGGEGDYCERVLRMPQVYSCYAPPDDAPDVGPLPAVRNGQVTFGSFNNPAKIGPQVVEVWARVLRRVPDARLVLRHSKWRQQETTSRFREQFAALGIAPERVDLPEARPSKNLLEEYRQVEIALDTFPYSGATTTCEALWMGVPVVTCPQKTFASRQATSFLANVGLSDLVAEDLAGYENLAVALAADQDRLTTWRSRLREEMAASPLCDGAGFAKDLMNVVGTVWRP